KSRRTEQANIALSKAIRIFEAPLRTPGAPADEETYTTIAERATRAENEFKAVAEQYSWTAPGKIAKYLAGTAALQAGDTVTAEKQLKAVAESGNRDLAPLAKLA